MIQIIDLAKDIIVGHTKNIFNLDDKLNSTREAVCNTCPLYTGSVCSSSTFIEVDRLTKNALDDSFSEPIDLNKFVVIQGEHNNRIAIDKVSGREYRSGCSCVLNAKRRLHTGECPVNKWRAVDRNILGINEEMLSEEEKKELNVLGVVKFAKKYGFEVSVIV